MPQKASGGRTQDESGRLAQGVPFDALHAIVDFAAGGDSTIVAAQPGYKIRVVGYTITAAVAGTLRWKSAANNKSGAMPVGANGGISATSGGAAHFETNAGEALVLNASAAGQVGGHVTYLLVT